MRSIDYDRWAQTYDSSRGVSPSVVGPVLEALGAASGRSLLDLGCGTGNVAVPFSEAGFRVTLSDFSPAMAQHAAAKLPHAPTAIADAQHLPFREASFDCVVSIKVVNHVPDWRAMLRELRRVICDGPAVLVHATAEAIEANWVSEYIPSLRDQSRYQREEETVAALADAGFQRVQVRHIRYRDMRDGSAQALKHFPEAFLAEPGIRNTSLFHDLSPELVGEILTAIRRDHESGRLQQVIERYEPLVWRHGDGALFAAWP